MIRLLGNIALAAACVLSIGGIASAVLAARGQTPAQLRQAKALAYVVFALLSLATGLMVYALVTHDFSVSYVAQVGSRSTPLFYTIISLWSALEGSILFWGWLLAGFTALLALRTPDALGSLKGYALAVMQGVGAFFYLLLIGPASPFLAVFPVPADGPGPNPLLQNHWLMGVHPPLLYLGYVGMAVPFAFALGSLLSGRTDAEWIRLTRRWTLTAWIFLSLAIVAGMWWSYEVLGWGGYWAWDPVENASFMPWLTATAFLHSVMVQERRGMLKVWNLSLVVSTFLLTILGTFLTRSGILSSVHAFAEGDIGYYFLGFIAVALVFSLVVLAGRSSLLQSEGRLDSVASRDTVFLVNNLVLTAFTFTVLLGTLFPLVAEALRGVKVSVGAPFFNAMTMPLAMALIFLMGVGPALPWRRASMDELKSKLLIPGIALLLVLVAGVLLRVPSVYAAIAFAFAAFALLINLQEFWRGAQARMRAHGENALQALWRLVNANRARYGGYIAHVGVVLLAVGIAASSAYRGEYEKTLRPGEVWSVAGQELRLVRIWGEEQPHRFVVGADLELLRNGRVIDTLTPRMNYYEMRDEPIPTPAVRSRLTDLYLNLMAFDQNGTTATVAATVEPLVAWIWLGGFVIALGAFIALLPNRRARPQRPATPAQRQPKPRQELATAGGD